MEASDFVAASDGESDGGPAWPAGGDASDDNVAAGADVTGDEAWAAPDGHDPDGVEGEKDGESERGGDSDPDEQEEKHEVSTVIEVGSIVEVESRTWPGINKPGGSGRVAAVHRAVDEEGAEVVTFDVRYVLGGVEKNIDSEFVQLSWMVQQGMQKKRDPVARNYYHDAFIEEPLKKKREKQKMANRPHARNMPQPSSAHQQHISHSMQTTPNKAPSYQKQKLVAASKEGEEEEPISQDDNRDSYVAFEDVEVREDNTNLVKRLGDHAFFRENRSEYQHGHQASASSTTSNRRHKQYRRETMGSNQLYDHENYSGEALLEQPSVEDDTNSQQRHKKRKRSKRPRHDDAHIRESGSDSVRHNRKRRYVGGYHHSGDDPDANFIQPEENPSALPEDVARETQFVLAKSKEGLRKQAIERLSLFTGHMEEFAANKTQTELFIRNIREATSNDIQQLYRKLSEMEGFITKKLVRQGENVINAILEKLATLRASLSESEELAFENQVRMIQEHRIWVRDATASVQTVWNSKFSGSTPLVLDKEDSVSENDSEGSATSSDASVDFQARRMDLSDFVTNNFVHDFNSNWKPQNRQQYARDTIRSSSAPRRRNRGKTSTFMTDFLSVRHLGPNYEDFHDAVPTRSNFRQIKSHTKGQPNLDEKKFAWKMIVDKAHSKRNFIRRTGISVTRGTLGESFHQHSAATRPKISINDTSGDVQAKAWRLLNKRHQTPKQSSQQTQQPLRGRSPNRVPSYDRYENSLASVVPPAYEPTLVRDSPPVYKRMNGKRPRSDNLHQSTLSSPSEPGRIDWERVFDILPESFDDPTFTAETRLRLLGFGETLIQSSAVRETIESQSESFTIRLARLRQQLTDLRVQEFDLMEQLPSGYEQRIDENSSLEHTPSWKALQLQQKQYHDEMVQFCASFITASKNVITTNAGHLFDVIEGIGVSIRQLPDCESMFVGCPEYFFYFDVEFPTSKTTPLLSAVVQTYWYLIQLLAGMQTELQLRDMATGFEQLIDGVNLVLERVVDAAMLFLFDWYLYLPTSHILTREDELGSTDGAKMEVPGLSLWLLLANCFNIETTKDSKPTSFWNSFFKLCFNSSFLKLATCFIRQESPGGYLSNAVLPNFASTLSDETQLSGMLLGLDSCWMILVILDKLLGVNDNSLDLNRWNIVKNLLGDNQYFLPFSVPTSPSPLNDDDLDRFDSFCVRVLPRLVVLRDWLPSDQDVIKWLVPRFLENLRPHQALCVLQLPPIFKRVAETVVEGGPAVTATAFIGARYSDALSMMCLTVWLLLSKPAKQVGRRRSRNEVTKILRNGAKAIQVSNTEKVNLEWSWGNKDATSSNKAVIRNSTEQGLRAPMEKKQCCIAVLLATALALASDPDNVASANGMVKDKKRENEANVYCDEILNFADGVPELSVMASQALYVFGSMLMTTSVEYVKPFAKLNAVLVSSLAVASDEADSIPKWKDMLNENKKLYRDPNAVVPASLTVHQRRFRVLQSTILSSLHLLRDLTSQLCSCIAEARPVRTQDELDAAQAAYSSIIDSGLADSIVAVVNNIISVEDMNIAIEIIQMLLPRREDTPSLSSSVSKVESFSQDEFHDDEMNDIYANFDLDGITNQAPTVRLSIDELAPHALELVYRKLRIELQKLLIKYPSNGDSSFQELYVIDLFGRLLSEFKFHFTWSQLSTPSLKPRYIASRLFSATMKYNQDKEWLCNNFLIDRRASQDLANIWMMATVNTSTLRPTPLTFGGTNVTFSLVGKTLLPSLVVTQVRDSNSWVMLTDSVVFHLLCNVNQLIKSKMDPQLHDLLSRVAGSCQFPREITKNPTVTESSAGLYTLHLDLFRAFTKSAGDMRNQFESDPSGRLDVQRQKTNSLRSITLDPHRGIFPTFIEAYELNIRNNCNHIEDSVINLSKKSEELMSAFIPDPGECFHDVDDMNRNFEAEKFGLEIEHLLTMLQFLYQCVDMLFFYCGELATGHDNLFTTILYRLFRQAASVEFSQAQRRLESALNPQHLAQNPIHSDVFKGVQPYVSRFVQTVQVYFAQQKYPTLLHWSALTSDVYHTFTGGWPKSPLRKLLLNLLDPEGPLGIHSYYPVEMKSRRSQAFDVKNVRREAFYLACGLFVCKCTNSFEHCKPEAHSLVNTQLVRKMRKFVLGKFICESLHFAADSCDTIDETLLPLLQLLRAVLNHINMNRRRSSEGAEDFSIGEIHASFEWIVIYFARVVSPVEAIQNGHRTVELIEFCGIIDAAIEMTTAVQALEIASLLELSRLYLSSVDMALSMTTMVSPSASQLAVKWESTQSKISEQLRSFGNSSVSAIAGFKSEWIDAAMAKKPPQVDAFSVSVARARVDLLITVRRFDHRAP